MTVEDYETHRSPIRLDHEPIPFPLSGFIRQLASHFTTGLVGFHCHLLEHRWFTTKMVLLKLVTEEQQSGRIREGQRSCGDHPERYQDGPPSDAGTKGALLPTSKHQYRPELLATICSAIEMVINESLHSSGLKETSRFKTGWIEFLHQHRAEASS